MLNLKKILDIESLNFETIEACFKNREQLIKEGLKNPTFEDFANFKDVSSPLMIDYYLGNNEMVSSLIPISNKSFIPIFQNDLIEITEGNYRTSVIKANVFLSNVLDGFAEAEQRMFSTGTNDLLFKIHNIREIKIHSEDTKEINSFLEKVNEFDLNKETTFIHSHFIKLICEQFAIKDYKLSIITNAIIPLIKNGIDTTPNRVLSKNIVNHITLYLKSKDVLHLVNIIHKLNV